MKKFQAITFLFAILSASEVDAGELNVPDVPRPYRLHEKSNTSEYYQSYLQLKCTPVYDGGWVEGQAECSFVTISVSKPAPKDTFKKLGEIDSLNLHNQTPTQIGEMCKGADFTSVARLSLQESERKLAEMWQSACASKDANQLVQAVKYNISEIEANTCKVSEFSGGTVKFTKKNNNTWRGVEETLFGNHIVYTLSRKSDKDNWSLRAVKSGIGEPGCNEGVIGCVKPSITDFVWQKGQQPTMNCPIVDLNP